ncbi:pseudouridine synthase [Aurantibacillus circumpalustris]|uniref:pseudouridine synthase n=1 Tax=Aurantibacillus circumpalustris TaxID=3036359 RepID=UPI00295ABE99|nr:pseudouridine synthase [Aurantibacillus circumpalustris]
MLSNKRAQELIDQGLVEIDGIKIYENCLLEEHSEIKVNGKIERKGKEFVYLKFNKPAGFESSLNAAIPDNIGLFFNAYENLAIAGRLDKHSEGLMLLSNDGKWVENICNPKFEKEKEYIVTLDKIPNEDFFTNFRNGVKIGAYLTSPCICEAIENNKIKVILKEGKNRQIRRMCKTLNYQVLKLVRIRIDQIVLQNLDVGESKKIYNDLIII